MIELKKCKGCGSYLIPIEDVWFHPDVKCDKGYGKLFDMEIVINDDTLHEQLQDKYGKPEYTLQDVFKQLSLSYQQEKQTSSSGWLLMLKNRVRKLLKRE